MSSPGDLVGTGADGQDSASVVAAQRPVAVRNCTRIGRVANPPGFSFTEWFRAGRRR